MSLFFDQSVDYTIMITTKQTVKRLAKRLFLIFEVPWNSIRGRNRWGVTTANLLEQIPVFDPNSGFGYRKQKQFLLESANNTFFSLSLLAHALRFKPGRELERLSISDLKVSLLAKNLKGSFDRHGSDKATGHNYHIAYAQVIELIQLAPNGMMEIGLGSNNRKIASNMGRKASPGASLRAFEENTVGPLFGCDIDQDALFETPRTKCFVLDQLDREGLWSLAQDWNPKLDLLIDDGLHSITANINSLALGLLLTHNDGIVVIEDIRSNSLSLWEFVSEVMIMHGYWTYLLEDFQGSFLFIVSKSRKIEWQFCD